MITVSTDMALRNIKLDQTTSKLFLIVAFKTKDEVLFNFLPPNWYEKW